MTEVWSATEDPKRFRWFCLEQLSEEFAKPAPDLEVVNRWLELWRASKDAEYSKKSLEEGPGVNPGDLT